MKSVSHKRSSIVVKLILGITGLTLLLLFILGGIIYFRISKLNAGQFNSKLNETITLTDTTLETYFKSIQTSTSLVSQLEVVRRNDERITSYVNLSDPSGKIPMKPLEGSPYEAEVYTMEKTFVQEKPELLGVSVALQSNGSFVRFPEEPRANGYDSRVRSWYKAAVADNGKVHFSDAYTTSAGEMVIAVSKTITGMDGSMRGVVSVDANLSNLAQLLGNVENSKLKKTTMILVDNTGSILVNSYDPSSLFKKITEIGIKGLKEYKPGDKITFTEKLANGVSCDIRTIPSSNDVIPLNYIVLIPHSELNANNDAVTNTLIFLLVIGCIFSVTLARCSGTSF